MFKLTPEAELELAVAREYELTQKQTFKSLTDESLIVSAKFWMVHCQMPKRIAPEEPIYDSTMWHAIIPELIRRLEEKL